MTMVPDDAPNLRIRWWPALALLAVGVFCVTVLPIAFNRTLLHFMGMMGGPVLCSLGFLVWWATASRVRGTYRWLPVALFLAAAAAIPAVLYPKDPMLAVAYGVPFVALLWFGWLLVSFAVPTPTRLLGVLVMVAVGWLAVASVRIEGTSADMEPTLRFRWEKTAEQEFAEELATRPKTTLSSGSITVKPGDAAEFRGPNRDSRLVGATIRTDWEANPPKLLWKQRIGPGWGSFSVVGDRLFTQEQRGEDEAIVCYQADTGREIWEHRDRARFEEAIAQSGPRATPTIRDGKLFATGATGILNCLEADTGAPKWSINLVEKLGAPLPQWGFSSSPLVVKGLVVVFAGVQPNAGTVAFRADDGQIMWSSGDAKTGYSSAHLATLGGVEQVLMAGDTGVESFNVADGKKLWAYVGGDKQTNRVSQPAVLDDSDLLLSTGVGNDQGLRRLRVKRTGETWGVETVWNSKAAKPYFNDGVVHKGHFYGYDGATLVCVELEKGKRIWSAGAVYGHGQVVLVADQDLLVVQAADGKVALVEAKPDEYVEVAKFQAIQGKTWNHPVLAHGRLYLRNGTEAACYDVNGK